MIDLILVGCGIMGARHLRAYGELERVRPGSLRLRAVCDPRTEAAERVAAEAEGLLGYRPRVCRSAGEALEQEPGILAADVATINRTHPEVVVSLLEAGVHVQVEKPLAVTVAQARKIVDAAGRTGRILAVAENNRRDPMNRLLRHVIRSGAIGSPHLITQLGVSSGQRVIVTPWRHAWSEGGVALDVGIHPAYMLEYLLGPVQTVYARKKKVRETREWAEPGGSPQTVPVESDDLYTALLTFQNGAQGVWLMHFGSAGEHQWQRTVHGEEGMVAGPGDRSGRPVRLERGKETLEGEALVAALPDFHLSDIETRLFGERPAGYQLQGTETDRKLIAAETADFLDAVRDNRPPEVPAEVGLRSVGLIMALLESAHSGSPVEMEAVLSGAVHEFQDFLERRGASGD
jgi:predicted dehydrogenase